MSGHVVRHRLFVAKERHKFAAAHMTVFPDGTKERLHGHNYTVEAVVEVGDISLDKFVDFGVIKRILDDYCAQLDERLILAWKCPLLEIVRQDDELEFKLAGKRYVVPKDEAVFLLDDNVTTETLAHNAASQLVQGLEGTPAGKVITAVEVSVSESPGQGAICRIEV